MPGIEVRELALSILLEYQRRDAYLNALLRGALASCPLEERDRALTTELVQGTVRMKGTLDWILRRFSDRLIESLEQPLLWALRLAVYQILFTAVPEYAAVDLAVESTRRQIGRGGASYANGVLRALVRAEGKVEFPDPDRDPVGYLEARYSHPGWVVAMWLEEYGLERTESLCAADNRPLPVSIRCNLMKANRDELALSLSQQGFEVKPSILAPEGILVRRGGRLRQTQQFRDGHFSIQGQGSILAGRAVSPEPGMKVLDMCSAPGGKANHLAEIMRNRGKIIALDINPGRLSLVEETSRRLGHDIIETRLLDATVAAGEIEDRFDRVLVDAPCTGLGTLSRRPDVRWRKVAADIPGLTALQSMLLEQGAELVKRGGLMIYSTCTISPPENRELLASFLEENPGFIPVDPARVCVDSGGPFLQLFPDTHLSEGMFIAVLRKVHQ